MSETNSEFSLWDLDFDSNNNTTRHQPRPKSSACLQAAGRRWRNKWKTRVVLIRWLQSTHKLSISLLYHDPVYENQVKLLRRSSQPTVILRGGHLFDSSEYKANRQMRMSAEAKRILNKHPSSRTTEEINYATIALRNIRPIADYPLRMQQQLASYGVFESYNEGRVIVREGKAPEAFYFILFGTVIVSVFNGDSSKSETKCFLHRHDSFGELAIMNKSTRQSTVITKCYTELLSISTEIYEKVFMVGGKKNINDPDHQQFIEKLPFFQRWPTELLFTTSDPRLVIFAYFRRGAVLVRDSNFSDWIYIVKSGSVQVLKKLVRVRPRVDRRTGQSKVSSGSASDHLLLNFLTYNAQHTTKPSLRNLQSAKTLFGNSKRMDDDNLEWLSAEEAGQKFKVMPRRQIQSAAATRRPVLTRSESIRPKTAAASVQQQPNTSSSDNETTFSEHHLLVTKERRTYLDDLDSAFKNKKEVITEADKNPAFVKVQLLTKGDSFGLPYLLFKNQPSLSLVSNGSECLLVSKQLFLQHCSERLFQRLQVQISPYPSDERLQHDYVTRVQWTAYKRFLTQQQCRQRKP